MTSRPPAPPLPKPPHPAVAAKALAEAAYAAARAWAQPLEPDSHNRATSQLYSTLRDLGIAARGLARYQMTGASPDPGSRDFPRYVTASARWLLSACESLDGVLAAEGTGSLPDPDESGAVLCRTARTVILAWRQPSGTGADRDITVRRFITATGFLSSATLGLAVYAPRHRLIDLQVVNASLAEVIAYLTAAIGVPAEDPAPGHARCSRSFKMRMWVSLLVRMLLRFEGPAGWFRRGLAVRGGGLVVSPT